jgi:hypothetical protein
VGKEKGEAIADSGGQRAARKSKEGKAEDGEEGADETRKNGLFGGKKATKAQQSPTAEEEEPPEEAKKEKEKEKKERRKM